MDLEIPTQFERDWNAKADEPVRFAVIGLGGFARNTALPAIEASEYCETTAVVSGSPEKARGVANEFGADRALTYEEYEAGEGSETYDAVYVCTPNALHLPHVEVAADLGKDVLCEKPLEVTADRAERLVAACEDAGVTLMTAYRMQTARSIRWLRRQVEAGVVGDPVRIDGKFSFPLLANGDEDQWRIDPDLAGGGALMDIGVYPINTARFVLDEDPAAVRATTHSTQPAFEGVDEHVAAALEFPDAVTATCAASFNAASTSRFAVTGTEGRIVVDSVFGIDDEREITVEADGGQATFDATAPSEVEEEFDYFAARGGSGPDGRHGLVDLEITEAVYDSSERGERIELRD